MDEQSVFETVIEPSVERVPVLELAQAVEADGINLEAIYLLERTVLTAFDKKLSDHLAAVDGAGFPQISLRITIRDPKTDKVWTPVERRLFATIPHALHHAGTFALGDRESCNMTVFSRTRSAFVGKAVGITQEVSQTTLEALRATVEVCQLMGEFEYLHVTGNFNTIVIQTVDHSFEPVVIDLVRGTVTVPSTTGGTSFVGPLYDPVRRISENRDAASYFTQVNHRLTVMKEKAIWEFRAAAEERIFGFDKALDGEALTGYRLTAAETLVQRVRAGMGENLLGLSEPAQITALGWAGLILSASERRGINTPGDADGTTGTPSVRLISGE
ncbi:hypothetical protein KHP62_01665 [Rhodobacteraceae bacterium NNCM2]|nr:hypothetical protein [Coraliihabitans acroporae]